MSINHSYDSLTRSILTKTLTTISNVTETLEELLIDEKTTLTRLEELRYQVKETERKYENLKDLIEATRASKEKMEMVAHDLRCFLSPLKTLPIEILVKIFGETIDQADKKRRLSASKWKTAIPDRTALLLTQVCARWRSIFSLNPSLWRVVEFQVVGSDGVIRVDGEGHRFGHHVKRGSPSQQSLFIPDWNQEVHTSLLKTLQKYPLWPNSLEMDMADDPVGSWDVQAIKAKYVTVYRSNETPTSSYITPLLRSAHEVTLYGNPPAWGSLPWVALRTLVIREFSTVFKSHGSGISFMREDLSQLLNAVPFLENLQLGFKVDEALLAWDTSLSITHTHLRSLTVHLHHFVGAKGLFGIQLDLPALRTIEFLSIHCRLASAEDDDFICKLGTPTKLVLPELESHELQLAAELLRWLPNVKYMDMVGENVDTLLNVTRAMYHPSPPLVPPFLVPALTMLHIENTDLLGETLVEFVRVKLQHKLAGIEGVAAMENIEMYETSGVCVDDWEKIQGLLREGCAANNIHSST